MQNAIWREGLTVRNGSFQVNVSKYWGDAKILRVSYDHWYDYIDKGAAAINMAMRELLPVIRRDLGVEHDRASVLKLFR